MTLMLKDHTGNEFDFDALPDASRRGLAMRGYGHVMSNEVASIVVGNIRRAIVNGSDRKPGDVSTDEIKAFRSANADTVDGYTAAAQTAKHAQVTEGTLGMRAESSAVNPLDRLMLSIARQEIKLLFKKQDWAFPTKDGEVFKMGDNEFTGDELVERWLNGEDKSGAYGKAGEANAPRIERMAQRQLRERNATKAAVAKADTSALAASLGL